MTPYAYITQAQAEEIGEIARLVSNYEGIEPIYVRFPVDSNGAAGEVEVYSVGRAGEVLVSDTSRPVSEMLQRLRYRYEEPK